MTPKTPLDFTKVEALRRHMLLTTTDMADVFGVSRMTYYSWLKGKALRRANDEKVRVMLKRLLTLMSDHGWPMPEVIASDQKQRREHLNRMLGEG
jgi:DNA-binding XRE family transcriptional regulator